MQQIRMLALTTVMTVLIWIAADQRVTRAVEIDVLFRIKPVVGNSMALEVVDRDVDRLKIEFRGASRAINRLRATQDSLTIELEISERDSARYELDLLEELRRQREQLHELPDGIAIASVVPRNLTIVVDRYVDRKIRLAVGRSNYEFDSAPRLDPLEVRAKVPEKGFDRLTADQRVITIPVDRMLENALQEGRLIQKEIAVPKVLDGGLPVIEIEPQQVTFSATLVLRMKEDSLRTVPIRAIPATLDLFDRYQPKFVEKPEDNIVTRLIVIRGPTDLVAELVENFAKYDVFGYITINRHDVQDDAGSVRILKPVHIANLPQGVDLVGEPEQVEIELVLRP